MCIWQPHVKLNVAHKSSPVSLNITVLLPKDLIPSIKVIILLLYQNQPTHKHIKWTAYLCHNLFHYNDLNRDTQTLFEHYILAQKWF